MIYLTVFLLFSVKEILYKTINDLTNVLNTLYIFKIFCKQQYKYTYFITFWLIIEFIGRLFGPCEGIKVFPLLFTTFTDRTIFILYGSAEWLGYGSNVPILAPPGWNIILPCVISPHMYNITSCIISPYV